MMGENQKIFDIFQGVNKPGEREALLRTVLERLPFAVVIVDREGRIGFTNPQADHLFGYDRGELLGRPAEILMPERFQETHTKHRAGFLVEPRMRPMGDGLELIGRRRDGSEFPVEISLSPVHIGEAGRDTVVIAVINDVTERQSAELALRNSEERIKSIIDNTTAVIYVKDVKGRYLMINRRFKELFHLNDEQILGRTDHDLFPQEAADVFTENDRRVIRSDQPLNLEEVADQDDGPHTFISVKFPLKDGSGHPYGVCGISTDITEQKRAEELLRASEQRLRGVMRDQEQQLILSERLISFGELTASLAHEFNNPLGIVIGYAQDLLTEVDSSDPRHQSVKIIEEEARRCKKIMQDLLDFGRQAPPEFKQMSPLELVRKSVDLLGANLQKNQIRTVIGAADGLPKIWVDPQQIEQVLVNVIFNAIEAMPEGGNLTVGFSAHPPLSPSRMPEIPGTGGEVMITVEDTGAGISTDQLSKIFLPFFTTKSKKGMGLGLSICKSIMEAHGGKISAESPPGRGATFYLHLPVDRRRSKRDEPVHS
jgi:PAS domain S-box-containing protein